ncbi:hypothetical protein BDP27DRAFT_1356717 [Rhodocollybia butyracea]|uniref:Uncharacterized protein n=1 Tax=Rhodocollybia butyracea TaxID=206335 RepID=A0A9P5QB00_9AGAR|nr:hypothetical protein BDP27DRAFT_1356717 [Rhodocollybia butyracea]
MVVVVVYCQIPAKQVTDPEGARKIKRGDREGMGKGKNKYQSDVEDDMDNGGKEQGSTTSPKTLDAFYDILETAGSFPGHPFQTCCRQVILVEVLDSTGNPRIRQ